MACHILFVSHDASLYGAQLSLLGLLKALDRKQFRATVVVPEKGPLVDEVEALDIPVFVRKLTHWVPTRSYHRKYQWFQVIRDIRRRVQNIGHLIREENIDIVYTNTVTAIEGALAARWSGVPHIWHLREHVVGNDELKSILPPWVVYRAVSTLAAKIIVNSDALKAEVARYIVDDKVLRIYNGIDLHCFEPNVLEGGSDAELEGSPAEKIVTIVGALHPRKGLGFFIECAKKIVESFPNVRFLIVGNGRKDYVGKLHGKVQQYGLAGNIDFLGWRRDVPRILSASDVVVLASKQEPFGRVVIEAMAAGKPVVATSCGGPKEIIVEGSTGYLRDYGDVDGFAGAIVDLLQDEGKARAFGTSGRRVAIEKFSVEKYAQNVQQAILTAIEMAGRRV